MQIDIEMDRVIIEGQVILRPDSISRSSWMWFWERCAMIGDHDA